jgi:triacylglycerol lipase
MNEINTRALVDSQLLSLLDTWPTVELSAEMLPTLRNAPPRIAVNPADIARADMEIRTIPGPKDAPDVEVRIYRPHGVSDVLPGVLHIHGGGYVMGRAAMMEAAHRPLVADLRCCVVSVEYRLAPETPYPGSVEDCYAALRYVCGNGHDLGIDASRLGVMGESAGGGLAAALALLVRDRREFKFAFQHLIYPMLDDRTCVTEDPHPHVGEFIWTPHNNRFGWASLLGKAPGGSDVSIYAAAARAQDLSDLPRTFIATGALDLFLEENIDYARRLTRAGVPVELHVYPGAFHGFNLAITADVTKRAARDSKAALARALAGT